jgi:molybdate transport system regulatory protein
MLADKKHELSYKVLIQCNNKPVLDQDGALILEVIDKTCSIAESAKTLKVSYRYVWNYIRRMNEALDAAVVETFKGGKDGGGGAKLTRRGRTLLLEYRNAERYLETVLSASNNSEVENLKLSARNQLKGKVVEVQKGVITAKVKVEVLMPVTITAIITKDAVDELDIKVGDEVAAIVKSTEIMIAK